MWLKLEFPLAGEAEKQENRGWGKREKRGRGGLQLQVYTRFVSWSLGSSCHFRRRHALHADRQGQEIALNSYKVRLQREGAF